MASLPKHDMPTTEAVEQVPYASKDRDLMFLNDAHRAALEDNPEKAERMSWSALASAFFLGLSLVGPVALGYLVVVAVLVQIGTALGDLTNITWVASGYAVSQSVSFSIAGNLSDFFGRRYLILAGNLISLIGAIIGGTAKSVDTPIAGMVLLGLGSGLVFVGYAGISEIVPNKFRGAGLAWTEVVIFAPWGSACVILGNLLQSHASWRWIFYITIIYCATSFIGVAVFYFPPARPQADFEKSRIQELKEIDYIGLTLYTGGLTSLLFGFSWAGSEAHPWNSASVIAPIVVGIAALIACFAYDFTYAKNPFFPLRLFGRIREFTILLSLVFVSGMCFFSMSALLPQATLLMFSQDPVQIGLISLPGGLSSTVIAAILGAMVHKIKHVRLQIIIAVALQTIFIGLYSVTIPNKKAAWMALQFFGQGCFAIITLFAYVTTGLHVPQRDLGTATGLVGTFRSAGGSVGVAIFSTILRTAATKQLVPRISAAALAHGYPASNLKLLIPAVISAGSGVPGAFAQVPGVGPALEAATVQAFKDAYAYAFRRVFWSTIPFGVLATIAAWFVSDPSKYMTNHVATHMEKEVIPFDHHTQHQEPARYNTTQEHTPSGEKDSIEHGINMSVLGPPSPQRVVVSNKVM